MIGIVRPNSLEIQVVAVIASDAGAKQSFQLLRLICTDSIAASDGIGNLTF